MDLLAAVVTKLRATEAVTSRLGVFDYGSGDTSAIFVREADENAPSMRLVLNESGGGKDATLMRRGWTTQINVRIEGDKLATDDALRELAWEVVKALDESDLTMEDYYEIGTFADPPQQMDAGLMFPAYLVNVRVAILEKEEQ